MKIFRLHSFIELIFELAGRVDKNSFVGEWSCLKHEGLFDFSGFVLTLEYE